MKPVDEAEADEDTRERKPEPATVLPGNARLLEGYGVGAPIDCECHDLYWRRVATHVKDCARYTA